MAAHSRVLWPILLSVSELADAMGVGMGADLASRLDRLAAERGRPITEDDVEMVTLRLIERGRGYTAQNYVDARRVFDTAAVKVARMHQTYDIILSPIITEKAGKAVYVDLDDNLIRITSPPRELTG